MTTDHDDMIADAALEQASDWLLRLQAAPGDADVRRAFEAWVAADTEHGRAFDLARQAWHLGGLEPTPLPAPARVVPFRRRLVAAAMLAVAAALFGLVAAPGLLLWLQADHLTGTGEAQVVVLEDGSRVTLDADSALTARMAPDGRQVDLLRGQAFFEVAPDKARPFTVAAADMRVTVTGTAFDVALTTASLSVTVASGTVRVAHGATRVDLVPGQRVVIDRRAGTALQDTLEIAQVATWRAGRLAVRDAALPDVVEAIGRYHRGLIIIADNSLERQRVTGVYDLHDPLRALSALAGAYGGHAREITPLLIILSAD